ncbi:alpha/beta hydrolase [Saccharibacillus sp. CPCC 101409]|uniref:alpha/beta hydrolase n=1 Tax=Saccharibacillus sp. CPCC 101409 TaxID=3058041 RepID=UPI002674004E|nr:alpha/beta hydrolase [Saccharibacillus sp. CPCC 101409]MDO3412296.1 alpha/beta hydrolase [Saccharibacillus sp. CPCC 101409]
MKTSKALLTALGVAAVPAAVVVAGSFYFYRMAVARAPKAFLASDPGLQPNPDVQTETASSRSWWAQQPFDHRVLLSGDGLKLHAYYLPARKPTAQTAILAHGYSGDASIMSGVARYYREDLGMNILVPDARGHGRSEGAYIGYGWHERLDYLGWIRQTVAQTGTHAQIVLHGISMGGATVMMTSGEDLPPQVKAIVEDCGYTSVKDELAYQMKRMYKLPAFPMLPATEALTRFKAGYSFTEASALSQVRRCRTPMLFIHGSNDQFVPTSMVHELYEACPSEKELLIVDGAGHGDSFLIDKPLYTRSVTKFLRTRIDGLSASD